MQKRNMIKGKAEQLVLKDDNKRIDKIIQNSYLNPFFAECPCGLTELDFINPNEYLKKKVEDKIDLLLQQDKYNFLIKQEKLIK